MRERGSQEYARYSECEFCGKPITGKEYNIGAASHESCWKTWCDRGRDERESKDQPGLACFDRMGDVIGDKPIYSDDGRRYKDFSYGEMVVA